MSSQGLAGEDGIFLSVAHHQQQFRLLELPEELLELLNSPNAPWSVHFLPKRSVLRSILTMM
jgi:hypothetical protein